MAKEYVAQTNKKTNWWMVSGAVAITAVAASFSLPGLAKIFPGAPLSAMALGAALEGAKLITAGWLMRGTGNWLAKAFACFLVLVGMSINVVGVYGYLSSAHLQHDLEAQTFAQDKLVALDTEISSVEFRIKNETDQLSNLNTATAAVASKGRTVALTKLEANEKKNRDELSGQRNADASKLAELKTEKAQLDNKKKALEAETGPLLYIASLFGSQDIGKTVRSFTLVLAVLPDLFSVFLVGVSEKKVPIPQTEVVPEPVVEEEKLEVKDNALEQFRKFRRTAPKKKVDSVRSAAMRKYWQERKRNEAVKNGEVTPIAPKNNLVMKKGKAWDVMKDFEALEKA
jgi:hypothetical protein